MRIDRDVVRNPNGTINFTESAKANLASAKEQKDRALSRDSATIPIVRNGFVSSINNNVGIGFGLDWLHYNGCYYRYYFNPGFCDNLDSFWVPVDMQWNFFLATHWSVFGEPGLAIVYQNFGNYYGCYDAAGRLVPCGSGPNHISVEPIFFVGGRYHFSESAALTLRIGWPYASFGISFMP